MYSISIWSTYIQDIYGITSLPNDEMQYPPFENTDLATSPSDRASRTRAKDNEPIYESVKFKSPLSFFSTLVGIEQTVSPDPNIYEVPPGSIRNLPGQPDDTPNNITPPSGFRDERVDRSNDLVELRPRLQYLCAAENRLELEDQCGEQSEELSGEFSSSDDIVLSSLGAGFDSLVSLENKEHLVSDEHFSRSENSSENCQITAPKVGHNEISNMECGNALGVFGLDEDAVERYAETISTTSTLPEINVEDVDQSFQEIEEERQVNDTLTTTRLNIWTSVPYQTFSGSSDDDMTEYERRINNSFNENFVQRSDSDMEPIEDGPNDGVRIVQVIPKWDESDSTEDNNWNSPSTSHGEIVCESILQNKEKTKNYWEKLMMATKSAIKNNKKDGANSPTKVESVIEKEIRLQREREEALVLERQNALKLAKYAEEGPHSIPTTDEGNYSECSEEKDQSIDSSGEQETAFHNYHRTPSYESMSSGLSSSSDGNTKTKANSYKLEDTRSRETPIDKDIRVTKEREEEIKLKVKQFNLPGCPVKNKDEIKAELETISLKKCVSMSSLPLSSTAADLNSSYTKPGPSATYKFRPTPVRLSADASKKFYPAKVPRGLMKKFIDSHGRLPASFILSPLNSNSTPVVTKKVVKPEIPTPFPPIVKSQEPSTLRRPGYRSAEDKIQMELKEMKRREAELKQERARLLGQSQPNLLNIDQSEDLLRDNETCSLPKMGKLRSALSNPNLTNEKTVIIPKKCNELIDAWENMILKRAED